MDHVSDSDLWNQSGEQRGWKTHTLWDQWHCMIPLPVQKFDHFTNSAMVAVAGGVDRVWMISCFYRCWWRQSLFFAHWAQQWSVWSKLHQGTVWLVDTSADSDAIAGRTDVLLPLDSPQVFPKPRWPLLALPERQSSSSRLRWRSCSKPSFTFIIIGSASQRSDTKLPDHISLLCSVIFCLLSSKDQLHKWFQQLFQTSCLCSCYPFMHLLCWFKGEVSSDLHILSIMH